VNIFHDTAEDVLAVCRGTRTGARRAAEPEALAAGAEDIFADLPG